MHSIHGPLRSVALWVIWALLASCGGGGGGAGPGTPAGGGTPGTSTSDALSISLMSPQKVEGEYAETALGPAVAVFIRATGDYTRLSGRTIYAIVEDPDSLTGGVLHVSVDSNPPVDGPGPHAVISLANRQMNTPGHFQGEFKVHACLDQDCRAELAGSPLGIPYDVTVRAGMQLQHERLAVTVPFGSVPPEQTVDVGLPAYLSSWNALAGTRDTSFHSALLSVSKADVGPTTGRVTLRLAPTEPGTYTELAQVATNVDTPDRLSYNYNKTITVTYTVTPYPALDAFFWPAAGNFVRAQTESRNLGESDPMVVTNTGVSYQWRPVEYLAHPSAANGHPLADSWWINSGGIMTCTVYNDPRTCLPPGTYSARHRYSITKDGNTYDLYWPMTLQVNP